MSNPRLKRLIILAMCCWFTCNLLTSCTGDEAPTSTGSITNTVTTTIEPNPVSSPTVENILSPTFTASPVPPTNTPNPTSTTNPTPTSPPTLSWNPSIPAAIVLDSFWGTWSPVENEMIGTSLADPSRPMIAVASSPDFDLVPSTLNDQTWAGYRYYFSPSGKNLLSAAEEIEAFDPYLNEMVTLVHVDLHLGVTSEWGSFQWLELHGWMNENIAALSEYSGGGHAQLYILDVTKESAQAAAMIYGNVFKPNQHYLPFVEQYIGIYGLSVLTRYAQPEPGMTMAEEVPNPNVRNLPDIALQEETSAIFMDWLPDSNQMLVLFYTMDYSSQVPDTAELDLWDVDTNSIRKIIPGGLSGRFSPDGKWLAFYTYGALPLTESGAISPEASSEPPADGEFMLNLMDFKNRKVVLSLPTIVQYDYLTFVDSMIIPNFAFSPDSRWFVFTTSGVVETPTSGWPIQLLADQDDPGAINLLTLDDGALALSTPGGLSSTIQFSPVSDSCIIADEDGEWQFIDLDPVHVTRLTVSGGSLLNWNGWSADGGYYSFYIQYPVSVENYRDTFILAPP